MDGRDPDLHGALVADRVPPPHVAELVIRESAIRVQILVHLELPPLTHGLRVDGGPASLGLHVVVPAGLRTICKGPHLLLGLG